jgi:uncharacterized RDD family membrane protein YckC
MILAIQQTVPMSVIYALIGFMMSVVIAYAIFWIWTLVDCIRNEESGSPQKVGWTLAILFVGPIAAFAYNIGRRKRRKKELGR